MIPPIPGIGGVSAITDIAKTLPGISDSGANISSGGRTGPFVIGGGSNSAPEGFTPSGANIASPLLALGGVVIGFALFKYGVK